MAMYPNSSGMEESYRRMREEQERIWEQLQIQQMQQIQQWPSSGLLGAGGLGMPLGQLSAVSLPVVDLKLLANLKAAEPRKVTRRMPDSVSIITAWRAWGLTNAGGEWRLKALGKNTVWEPKKKFEATCEASKQHPAPQKDCTCGVWSFKTLDLLLPALWPYEFKVLGSVSLWGRVIETENGFRAQYAYPLELWLLDESLEEVGYIYNVPIRTAK